MLGEQEMKKHINVVAAVIHNDENKILCAFALSNGSTELMGVSWWKN